MKFQIGDRVRISVNHPWANGATGQIAEPPDAVRSRAQDSQPWDGGQRIAFGTTGPILYYWVTFDEPQDKGSSEGPATGGEIKAAMIDPE